MASKPISRKIQMKYQTRKEAFILLADGKIFHGNSIGDKTGSVFGQISFNTAMTGYQEILSDPSSFGQITVFTSAHIGGYGADSENMESEKLHANGIVTRNFSYHYSRTRAEESIEKLMEKYDVGGISGVDTRALTNYIRENGSMAAVISTEKDRIGELKEELKKFQVNSNAVAEVSAKEAYLSGEDHASHKVAVLDLGIKKSLLENLTERDCHVKVFPFDSSFEEMESFQPDGYFISNGPGDPHFSEEVQAVVKKIIDSGKPVFGVCLGHLMIALASGLKVKKLKTGHNGLNHPVKNLITGKGEMTGQNISYVIDEESVEDGEVIEVTHIDLNDDTIAGIRLKNKPVFSVQFQAGSKPGSTDSLYLFDEFVESLKQN